MTGPSRGGVKVAVAVVGLAGGVAALCIMLVGFTDATVKADRYTVSGSDGGPLCPMRG
ncbi:hypothetical protein [Mycobacterium sp. NS-7484]|uniref:hypothetical protein n=1 Tax=Mycobacterium sp. NS-7484 TaxID=1834161 RepID=UPI001300D86D|nr:hypothetical protein [Mycobacterium sp. NS-7484]